MSEKNDIWMPFYIGDYLADTSHLTTEQHGAYILLLLHQWRKGHFSEDSMAMITRLSKVSWAKSRSVLMAFFTKDADGLLYSPRNDIEKARSEAIKQSLIERGRKGGLARSPKDGRSIAELWPSLSPAQAEGIAEGVAEGKPNGKPNGRSHSHKEEQPPLPPSRGGRVPRRSQATAGTWDGTPSEPKTDLQMFEDLYSQEWCAKAKQAHAERQSLTKSQQEYITLVEAKTA